MQKTRNPPHTCLCPKKEKKEIYSSCNLNGADPSLTCSGIQSVNSLMRAGSYWVFGLTSDWDKAGEKMPLFIVSDPLENVE